MKLICFFVMLLVTMAQAKSFGADGAGQQPFTDDDHWFAQYQDAKDQQESVDEGDSLDVDVDAGGNLKSGS